MVIVFYRFDWDEIHDVSSSKTKFSHPIPPGSNHPNLHLLGFSHRRPLNSHIFCKLSSSIYKDDDEDDIDYYDDDDDDDD